MTNRIPNNVGTPPMCLKCGMNNHTKNYCKECRVSCKHCKSQKHASHFCAFIPRATSTSNGETSSNARTTGTSSDEQSQKANLPNSSQKQKKKKSKNQDKQRSTQAQAQQNNMGAHTAPPQVLPWVEMLNHPLKGSSSTHHPHQVDTCIHPHHHWPSSKYLSPVRFSYNRIPVLLLHSSRWLSSISNTLKQVRNR